MLVVPRRGALRALNGLSGLQQDRATRFPLAAVADTAVNNTVNTTVATSVQNTETAPSSDADFQHRYPAGFDDCDARLLAAHWKIDISEAKNRIGRLVNVGQKPLVDSRLAQAHDRATSGRGVRCDFTDSGYSFADANKHTPSRRRPSPWPSRRPHPCQALRPCGGAIGLPAWARPVPPAACGWVHNLPMPPSTRTACLPEPKRTKAARYLLAADVPGVIQAQGGAVRVLFLDLRTRAEAMSVGMVTGVDALVP